VNRILYRLMYWLGMSDWDKGETPPEVRAAFKTGDLLPGPALDLGCGTGAHAIFMATQDRQVIGIDFVPEAIYAARDNALQAGLSERTQFYVADVTRINELELPPCAFALDMGCFHGLSSNNQRRYAKALASQLIPGGRYMLYVLDPRKELGVSFGLTPARVREVFTPDFDILDEKRGAYWSKASTWFWMERKP
jgi:cyclopropane fatty-acyl-phospholipid synthase-like methyltransferase